MQQLQKVLDNIQAKDKANIFKDPVTEKIVSPTAATAATALNRRVPSAACAEEEAHALAGRDRLRLWHACSCLPPRLLAHMGYCSDGVL